MLKINLVPEVQENKLKVKRVNTYSTFAAIFIVGSLVFAILVISSITAITGVTTRGVESKTAEVKTELEEYRELEETVLSLEKGLIGVREILDSGERWAMLLNQMEYATPGDVSFKSLKIKENSIEAELDGRSVESLARFVESYKNHKVVVLSGTGTADENVSIEVAGSTYTTRVKSDGTWKYPVNFSPTEAQKIKVTSGQETSEMDYDPNTKKLSSDSGVSAEVKSAFITVETTQYSKQANGVRFDAKISFEGATLW